MRSALTVLGVVIGITSIVGMTAMIRGFDQSLRETDRARSDPNTIFIQRFGVTSFANGAEFKELMKRPNLTISDARALEDAEPTLIQFVDIELGAGRAGRRSARVFYRDQKTKTDRSCSGPTSTSPRARSIPMLGGRFFNGTEVQYRKNVVVLGNTRLQAAVRAERHRSDRQDACASAASGSRWSACSTSGRRRAASTSAQDDFVVIPHTDLSAHLRAAASVGIGAQPATITADPDRAACRATASTRPTAMADVERIMRIRHGLKLDEPNDFDLLTQDAFLKLWDQISQGDVLRAGRDLVDRADGRRHRRDGDHVDLGDRADARDRRAQGARRAPRRNPVSVPDGGGVPDLARRRARHRARRAASAGPCTSSPASRSRCPGGRSRSASASRRRSASSSACIRPFKASRLDPIEALRYE